MIDRTHEAGRVSWVTSAHTHPDFPLQNLPLGVFSTALDTRPRPGVAIGDEVLDLSALALSGLLDDALGDAAPMLTLDTLNPLLAQPASLRLALRHALFDLLVEGATAQPRLAPLLCQASQVTMHLPARIGDYTDFYAGIHHALNVGRQFRPDQPLLPNYKWVPIGYHGRASSIVVSGTPVVRPNGQRRAPGQDSAAPDAGPSRRLDYELELGVWVGPGSTMGTPVPITQADAHIAGLCLLNDWSARDLQAWEYQPLGPFLAKNFATSISPWIITAEALAPFRMRQPARPDGDPAPLPYLWDADDQAHGALDLELEVLLCTPAMRARGAAPHRLARGHASHLYWTIAQLLTHHTVNGCNLQAGDLLGTGTISTPTADGLGSLLELTEGGRRPVDLGHSETRTFLEDGDEIIMRARARREGFADIGLGEVRGIIQPAPALSEQTP
jgi:fumarylacetoacetase